MSIEMALHSARGSQARLLEGGLLVCSCSGDRGLGYRDGGPQRAPWQLHLPFLACPEGLRCSHFQGLTQGLAFVRTLRGLQAVISGSGVLGNMGS